MCFVRSLSWSFFESDIAPVLSAYIATGICNRRSESPFCSHCICLVASDIAMYSASVVDVATDACFFERHETQDSLTRTTYPENDRRVSKHAAKSAST